MNMKHVLLLLLGLALAGCQPKSAQPQGHRDDSATVATVNGQRISREFFESYIKAISGGKTAAELTAEQRDTALDNLIRAEVVGQEAIKEGVDKTPDTATMLELTRLNVLQQAIADRVLKDRKPSEQELRAEFETQVSGLAKQEYHARHILVATQPYAQKIVQRLEKGEKFDELARRESMDSSKDNGGDLGWFTPDKMVKPFSDAVMGLKPGEYTHRPVQTQYGWHIIQLVETRDLQPPTYDSVRQRLEQLVQARKVKANTDELMRSAVIKKEPAAAAAGTAAPASAGQNPPPKASQ
jgi:peptidyl-prolyl cis-trans isomerase C